MANPFKQYAAHLDKIKAIKAPKPAPQAPPKLGMEPEAPATAASEQEVGTYERKGKPVRQYVRKRHSAY